MNNIQENEINIIKKIILEKAINPVYQPIVSLKNGKVLAYEALSRITLADCSISIAKLFEYAGETGYLWELEKICRKKALKKAVKKPNGKKIFLNVDGNILQDANFVSGFTQKKLEKYGLKTKDIVFEITERSDMNNNERLKNIIAHYNEQGFEVAIDDIGSGYSGLNRLIGLKPSYVKIDYDIVHRIDCDKDKRSVVSMLVHNSYDMGYELIAEGIESREELMTLIELGVQYGQGFYIGKPYEDFLDIEKNIIEKIKKYQIEYQKDKKTIGNISKMGIVLYPSSNISRALSFFENNKNLQYISIVDSQCHFHGIVSRQHVMNCKSDSSMLSGCVENIMKTECIKLDSLTTFKSCVGKVMLRSEEEMNEPVIVIKDERYYGMVTIRDLIIAMGKLL